MIIIPTTLPMLKLLLVSYDGAYGGANQISSSNLSAKFEHDGEMGIGQMNRIGLTLVIERDGFVGILMASSEL
ncbi:hypothetical protein D5086_019906 [Populus alba]|uniref:Uncharacterized protein n=1 Tax=Populus alba TaxID=43335 RepID=A0ACC4BJ72_POPAL